MRWTLLVVGFCACGSPPEEVEQEEPEQETTCLSGCPVEVDETCEGCAQKIAKCCYAGREEFRPLVQEAMRTCEDDAACGACCNECAAKSCKQLIEAGSCPTVL